MNTDHPNTLIYFDATREPGVNVCVEVCMEVRELVSSRSEGMTKGGTRQTEARRS